MNITIKNLFRTGGLIALIAALTSCVGYQQESGRFNRSQQPAKRTIPSKDPGASARQGEDRSATSPGSYLAKSEEIEFELSSVSPANANASVSDIKDQPFSQALRASYERGETGPWMAVLKTDQVKPMKAGSQIVAKFYARSVPPFSPARDVALGFYVYRENPWVQVASNRIVVDDRWREYSVIFSPDENFKPTDLSLAFDFGLKHQAVEIANIRMNDVGAPSTSSGTVARAGSTRAKDPASAASTPLPTPTTSATYEGRSTQADWRKAADARIKQYRTGDLTLHVRDEQGRPISGAKVDYRLKQHAFGFGTAVNKRMLANPSTPDQKMYANKVKSLFNKAVLENGMKWNQWESSIAPFLKEDTLKTVAWLEQNGLAIRGNVLVWPGWDKQNPTDLRTLNKAQLAKRINDHIADIVGTFKGRVAEWDVVNESRTNQDFNEVLGTQAIADWFRQAKKIDPEAKLYHNDFGILNGSESAIAHLEKTVQIIRAGRGTIDGLGLQAHFDNYLPSPHELNETLDRLAKLGLEIQATEFDVNVGDEQTQADFTHDFLTVMFSHPAVTGVTFWGFWEGQHWKPSCALFRKNWTVKPNGQAYIDLVTKKWTSNGNTNSDRNGATRINGYYGDYEVTVNHGGKVMTMAVTHSPNQGAQTLQFGKSKPVVAPPVNPPRTTTQPKAAPAAPNTAPGAPKVIPAIPKVAPAVPKVAPAVPKVAPAVPKVAPAVPKVAPAVPKVTPRATAPALPRPAPALPKTTPAPIAVPRTIPVPKAVPSLPRPRPGATPPSVNIPKPNVIKPRPVPRPVPVPAAPRVKPPATVTPTPKPTPAAVPATPVPPKSVTLPKPPSIPRVTRPVAPRPATPTVRPIPVPKPAPAVPKTTPAIPQVPTPPAVTTPPAAPAAAPGGAAGSDARDRMEQLRERLRAAKERLAEKTKAAEEAKEK